MRIKYLIQNHWKTGFITLVTLNVYLGCGLSSAEKHQYLVKKKINWPKNLFNYFNMYCGVLKIDRKKNKIS